MGRETKLLLGLLATLAGVFMGVLSMKLLVRRPPPGAGPDVHVDFAATEPADLVEPPQYEPRPALRQAGTEVVADGADRPPSSRSRRPARSR